MKIYLEKPQDFSQLIVRTFAGYPKIFKATWYFYLLFMAIGWALTYVLFKVPFYAQIILMCVGILIEIFVYAVILALGHHALAGETVKFKRVVKHVRKRYLTLLGATLFVAIIGGIALLLSFAISALGKMIGYPAPFLVIACLFFIFVFLLFYFYYPLLILEQQNFLKSWQKSMQLFLLNSWHVVGMILLIIVCMLVIALPFAALLSLLQQTAVPIAVHLIFNFIIYPLTFSSILVLLHDCNVRYKIRKKRK